MPREYMSETDELSARRNMREERARKERAKEAELKAFTDQFKGVFIPEEAATPEDAEEKKKSFVTRVFFDPAIRSTEPRLRLLKTESEVEEPEVKGGQEVGERTFRVDLTAEELNNAVNYFIEEKELLESQERPTALSNEKIARILEELTDYNIKGLDDERARALRRKLVERTAVRLTVALTKEVIIGNSADQFLQTILTAGKLGSYEYLYRTGEYAPAIKYFTKWLEKSETEDPTTAGIYYRTGKDDAKKAESELLDYLIDKDQTDAEGNPLTDEQKEALKPKELKPIDLTPEEEAFLKTLSPTELRKSLDLAKSGMDIFGMAAFYSGPTLNEGKEKGKRLRDLAIAQELINDPNGFKYNNDPKNKAFRNDGGVWKIDLTENEFWRKRDALQDNDKLTTKVDDYGMVVPVMGPRQGDLRIYRDVFFSKQRFDALNRGIPYMRKVLETRGLGASAVLNMGYVKLSDIFNGPDHDKGGIHGGNCLNAGGVGAGAKKVYGDFGDLLDKGEVLVHANQHKQGNSREKYKALEPYLKLNFAAMDGYFVGPRAYEQSFNSLAETLRKALDFTKTEEAKREGILAWNSADITDALYVLYTNNIIRHTQAHRLNHDLHIKFWANFWYGGKDELAEIARALPKLLKVINIDIADIGA